MLRRTRIFVIILFIFSVVVSGGYRLYEGINTDRTNPVITMDQESITVSVNDGDESILNGVTATDAKDGDLTEKLFIESRSNFISKGKLTVTYAVADTDNHVTRASREVIYGDYKSPVFKLTQPLKFQTTKENQGDINIAANLSAYDVLDGNISNKIRISSDYAMSNYNTGDYPMEFFVTNSLGDTVHLPVTVTVYSAAEENVRPKIVMKNYIVNTSVGEGVDVLGLIDEISYRGYTYHRADDGNFYSGEYDSDGMPIMFTPDSLFIETNVDFNTPGVYEVKVNYTDAVEGISNYAYIYIVVTE